MSLREPVLSTNAHEVLRARYLRRALDGEICETPENLFARVAHAIAQAEKRFDADRQATEWEERFRDAMVSLAFLPNSPTLMNAGTGIGQLSACFVLPVQDSIDGIFTTLREAARVQQTGGGTGFNFSALRPAGDLVSGTTGVASGPLSFMRVFNAATEEMRQGGKRRGANMGILDADHPDIATFIDAKREPGGLRNFNLSVGASDAFMAAVETGATWDLKNPRTESRVASIDAAKLFRQIAEAAWATGDPGLVFLDAIERANPTPAVGSIRATNPCGEVPLLPYESCNLGSINVAACLRQETNGVAFDWDRFRTLVELGVRFLDDVIEVNRYPAPELDRAARANRKIGLGVMGIAEALIRLGHPYDSPEAYQFGSDIAPFSETQRRLQAADSPKHAGSFRIGSARFSPALVGFAATPLCFPSRRRGRSVSLLAPRRASSPSLGSRTPEVTCWAGTLFPKSLRSLPNIWRREASSGGPWCR